MSFVTPPDSDSDFNSWFTEEPASPSPASPRLTVPSRASPSAFPTSAADPFRSSCDELLNRINKYQRELGKQKISKAPMGSRRSEMDGADDPFTDLNALNEQWDLDLDLETLIAGVLPKPEPRNDIHELIDPEQNHSRNNFTQKGSTIGSERGTSEEPIVIGEERADRSNPEIDQDIISSVPRSSAPPLAGSLRSSGFIDVDLDFAEQGSRALDLCPVFLQNAKSESISADLTSSDRPDLQKNRTAFQQDLGVLQKNRTAISGKKSTSKGADQLLRLELFTRNLRKIESLRGQLDERLREVAAIMNIIGRANQKEISNSIHGDNTFFVSVRDVANSIQAGKTQTAGKIRKLVNLGLLVEVPLSNLTPEAATEVPQVQYKDKDGKKIFKEGPAQYYLIPEYTDALISSVLDSYNDIRSRIQRVAQKTFDRYGCIVEAELIDKFVRLGFARRRVSDIISKLDLPGIRTKRLNITREIAAKYNLEQSHGKIIVRELKGESYESIRPKVTRNKIV